MRVLRLSDFRMRSSKSRLEGGAELSQASAPARCPSHSGTSRKDTPRDSRAFQG